MHGRVVRIAPHGEANSPESPDDLRAPKIGDGEDRIHSRQQLHTPMERQPCETCQAMADLITGEIIMDLDQAREQAPACK